MYIKDADIVEENINELNRLEMAIKLFENPKLKAIMIDTDIIAECVVIFDEKYIRYEESHRKLELIFDINEKWKIIDPKLKEFDFGEAIFTLYNVEITKVNIKSIVSGQSLEHRYLDSLTLEEMKGKWTIDGYYE